MQKTGLVVVAALAVVGGIFVTYSGTDSPSGLAVGTGSGDTAALVKDLGSRNRKTRRAAAAALARSADLSALPALVAASEHEDSAFVEDVQLAIDRVVKRFPKNLGDFAETDWKVSIASVVAEDGEDAGAAALKDGMLEVLLDVENISVGESHDFNEGIAAQALPERPQVSIDLSGRITRLDAKACRVELDLSLSHVDVVVKRLRKVRASGSDVSETATECGREAARQALRYLGAR